MYVLYAEVLSACKADWCHVVPKRQNYWPTHMIRYRSAYTSRSTLALRKYQRLSNRWGHTERAHNERGWLYLGHRILTDCSDNERDSKRRGFVLSVRTKILKFFKRRSEFWLIICSHVIRVTLCQDGCPQHKQKMRVEHLFVHQILIWHATAPGRNSTLFKVDFILINEFWYSSLRWL